MIILLFFKHQFHLYQACRLNLKHSLQLLIGLSRLRNEFWWLLGEGCFEGSGVWKSKPPPYPCIPLCLILRGYPYPCSSLCINTLIYSGTVRGDDFESVVVRVLCTIVELNISDFKKPIGKSKTAVCSFASSLSVIEFGYTRRGWWCDIFLLTRTSRCIHDFSIYFDLIFSLYSSEINGTMKNCYAVAQMCCVVRSSAWPPWWTLTHACQPLLICTSLAERCQPCAFCKCTKCLHDLAARSSLASPIIWNSCCASSYDLFIVTACFSDLARMFKSNMQGPLTNPSQKDSSKWTSGILGFPVTGSATGWKSMPQINRERTMNKEASAM